ncbi:MAG: hypothetical protein TE42_05330 [Candidatus Synechococcus spongiarum SP3]|uniref:Sec-independent protein translocase protein TatA n=1 Tax=Candidatus Synechococcus spongiarum SP3 TaxID=1604020 RepID=A0A0G2HL51_9SYNE|nr:MAG: hypothetical protein TE42_05330 [Candidatus Synechococcus spongiarum SP3]
MSVFGVGLPEMAVIAVVGLLVFGPKKLPELGRTLGKTLKAFQSASQEFSNAVMAETRSPETPVSTTQQITSKAVSSPVESARTPEQHSLEDKA